MFVIKYDKISMIKLVQAIQKYPQIYDNSQHFTKEELDAAWDNVALAVGEKDSLCRLRWNSIKSCYIRHLKYTAINSRRKPYYLAEFMDFMIPHVVDRLKTFLSSKKFHPDRLPTYLKEALNKVEPVHYPGIFQTPLSSPQPGIIQTPISSTQSGIFHTTITIPQNVAIKEEVIDIEVDDDDDDEETEWLTLASQAVQQPSTSSAVLKRIPTNSVPHQPSKKIMKTNANPKRKTSKDDDVKFFLTITPDIARMSDHQKLKFKQEALSIIEDILYVPEEADDLNIM